MDQTHSRARASDRTSTERPWRPPSGPDVELAPAGRWWDAVRVPAYLGDRALTLLGEDGGAAIHDPYAHRLYWLVPTGAAVHWSVPDLAQVLVLGTGCWVAVPPRHRVRSTGPHWLRPVHDNDHPLTDPDLLHAALSVVIADALGPRGTVTR